MAQIQGALNRVKMLEHHIQHHKIIFVLAIMKSIHKYPTRVNWISYKKERVYDELR